MTRLSASAAFRTAALLGMAAVALGAFGAHALKPLLLQLKTTEIWEKAVFYHLVHAAVMAGVSARRPFQGSAWLAFGLGAVGFSGSLYLYAVTHTVWLTFITPFGGLALLLGWLLLAIRPRDVENSHSDPQ